MSGRPSSPIRVVIQQPSLAKYRVPVYRLLAQQPGIELLVVYGQDPGIPNVEPEGFAASFEPHRYAGLGTRRPFVWQPAQLKYADRRRADVLVLTWNSWWLSLPIALRKARRQGVRTVVWGHGYSKKESPLRSAIRRRVGLMADGMLFYSRSVADRYIAAGVDSSRVYVAPNAVDQQPIEAARRRWLDDPLRLEAFRREQGLDGQALPILYVSRFQPANRVDLLLEAAARLIPERPGLRVHLVGKGEPEMTRLRELSARLGLGDRVRFLGAIYEEDELAPWFLTAKAFCYPENIGLSLHHALGYGVPVVTGDNPKTQNPEFEALRDGVNAVLFRAGDAEDLARTLAFFLDSPENQSSLAQGARRTVAEQYNLDTMVGGFLAAIRNVTPAGDRNA